MAATDAVEQVGGGRAEALPGRLFGAAQETLDVLTVYIGDRLGLYRALADLGPLTTTELATVMRPATFRRYALQAGFRDLQVLDIDLPMQRYYRLVP